jgi:hypothetical protein
VSRLTSDQLRRREQFESVIRLAEPFLNAVLAAGDRLSRLVEPEDRDYYPPRSQDLPPPTAGPSTSLEAAPAPADAAPADSSPLAGSAAEPPAGGATEAPE